MQLLRNLRRWSRSCRGKKRLGRKQALTRAAQHNTELDDGEPHIVAYRCEYCRWYHTGHVAHWSSHE